MKEMKTKERKTNDDDNKVDKTETTDHVVYFDGSVGATGGQQR